MQIRLLCSSPNIIGAIKPRIMRRWACGTYGGEVRTGFWWEKSEGKDYLKDLGVDGMIILKWILRKYGWELLTGLILFSIGTGDRFM